MIDDDAYCIFPDLSPDGKLLVYSSDRAGSLDLWLQPVSGGSPIKLTDDSGNEDEAVFSPDGREIAYQSEQDGGGVFIIPVSGGSSREIARNGNHPTYSPDGRYIAYWEGDATSPTVRANTRVFIRPTTDGPARQVAIDVAGAQRPVFSADSKRILVERFDGEPARESVIFCAPLDGGPSIRTHIGEDLRRQQLSYPQVHYWGVNVLVVTATSGDIQGVWKVPFDSTRLAVTGKATSLALGTESSAFPKVRGSKMVFHGGTFSYNVWTLPLQADRVSAIGTPHRATGKVGRAVMPELAPDGRRLAYSYFPSLVATRSAGLETFLRDFDTGSEWLFTPSRTPAWAPHFFGDNNHLITTTGTEASRSVYETSATGGESIKLSDDCENASPSPSGRWLICQSTSGERLTALKISGRDRKEILSDGNSMMWGVRISPDENWITWVSTNKNSGLSQILVAPYRGQSVISRDEWVEVTRDESWFGYPAWSPAGNVIYYLSDRDGHRCIYAQRLRKGTKHPDGHPIAVYHYHGTQRLEWISQNWQNLSVAADKIAFLQPESKFTIWMADLAQDPN